MKIRFIPDERNREAVKAAYGQALPVTLLEVRLPNGQVVTAKPEDVELVEEQTDALEEKDG